MVLRQRLELRVYKPRNDKDYQQPHESKEEARKDSAVGTSDRTYIVLLTLDFKLIVSRTVRQ